jgi:hypothetical protein
MALAEGRAFAVNILFTNNTLGRAAGTELAIRDLCREMRRRGHEVAAYSTQWGDIARVLGEEGIPIVDDPGQVPWKPDIIHGHHEWETTLAALRWPECPVLSFCRGIESWHEAPCLAPNVVQWVAIDEPCRERLIQREGVPADRVRLILNGIDFERFRPRGPLPARPGTALLFSNYATSERLLPEVVTACQAENLQCEAIGSGVHRVVERPEEMLGRFDLVFAKGKAALEAVVSGCAVIMCDIKGLGPLVTAENFMELRRESFGFPCMTSPLTSEAIRARIAEWDPESSMIAQSLARETCGIGAMFDAMEAIYREMAAVPVRAELSDWARFASTFFASLGSNAKLGRELRDLHRQSSQADLPTGAFELSKEHSRVRDAFRKGQSARAELKTLQKRSGRGTAPGTAKLRRGFMGLFS